jgi:hypothetical protein
VHEVTVQRMHNSTVHLQFCAATVHETSLFYYSIVWAMCWFVLQIDAMIGSSCATSAYSPKDEGQSWQRPACMFRPMNVVGFSPCRHS